MSRPTHRITHVDHPDGQVVPTLYRVGLYAVHLEIPRAPTKNAWYAVTHLPSGRKFLLVWSNLARAKSAATLAAQEAGEAGAAMAFGGSP